MAAQGKIGGMIGLRIGAAELAEIEAGAPCVVVAPGLLLPHALPLVPLVLREGVLARPGADAMRNLPLPDWVRPLALVASEDAAARLQPLLPQGLPVVPDAAALLGQLAAALRETGAARTAAEAEAASLRRALGAIAMPLPRLALELGAAPGAMAEPPLTQPLGRPAEGLCAIELGVAQPGAAGLRIRLLASERVIGCWRLPPAALVRGPLALDLPEPAPHGDAEAMLEIAPEGDGAPPLLTLNADHPRGTLALRAWTAPPGWSVLPRFFDWHAAGAMRPSLPMPLPAEALAEATVEGATAELVGAGAEPPRLLLALPPAGSARLVLPPVGIGPADLLRARLTLRGTAGPVAAEARLAGADGAVVISGWRETDAAGHLALALPLPPGPTLTFALALRNGTAAEAVVEIAALALQAGAAGEPRRPPPAEAAKPRAAAAAVALPVVAPLAPAAWRAPAPRLAAAGPGGAPAQAAPVVASVAAGPPGAVGFQEVKLNQHLVGADGGYRHLDMQVAGLVAGGGLWRQLRLKLFDRRGTAGLEFREMAGWPQMFDLWPGGGRDNYGPFWRLETEGTEAALAALATPHDRALIAALLELLPEIAARAAGAAGLPAAEAEAWPARARRIAAAVAEARGVRAQT